MKTEIMNINPNMKISELRKLVDFNIKTIATQMGVKNFQKDKSFGEYVYLDFSDILALLSTFENKFGLPDESIMNRIYARNAEPRNFDYFDNLTFDKVANIVCQQIATTHVAKQKRTIVHHLVPTNVR